MVVDQIMTRSAVVMPRSALVAEAARAMRLSDIGDVLVEDCNQLYGIVTDRDIVVRTVAEGLDPEQTTLGDICSTTLITVTPDDSVDEAVRRMADNAIRRLPVVDGDRVVGIVSLGDLAMERDPDSALGQVSLAPPNL